MKPAPKLAGGSGDPPLRCFGRITAESDNGRGKPLPPFFGIFSVNAGVSPFEAARRVVAPYGRHGPQRAGDPLWPPVPCCRTFSLLPRRGGPLWPPVPAPWERPRPAHPRSRTLCHGWSKRGAAVKWHRPKFCAAPGPSGPGGIIPGTIFCAPEILHEGIGVSPVNGGPGCLLYTSPSPRDTR